MGFGEGESILSGTARKQAKTGVAIIDLKVVVDLERRQI